MGSVLSSCRSSLGFAYMAFGFMPVWSSLPALPSCAWWLMASKSPAVAAWCGEKLVVAEPESPSNKLVLHRRLRAGRRGGGVRRLFAGSGASCRFPSAWFIASFIDGFQWLFWLDILRGSGRAPRRYSFIDAKASLRAVSGRCGDLNGTLVPNRFVQVNQRPVFFFPFSTGFPVVRWREL